MGTINVSQRRDPCIYPSPSPPFLQHQMDQAGPSHSGYNSMTEASESERETDTETPQQTPAAANPTPPEAQPKGVLFLPIPTPTHSQMLLAAGPPGLLLLVCLVSVTIHLCNWFALHWPSHFICYPQAHPHLDGNNCRSAGHPVQCYLLTVRSPSGTIDFRSPESFQKCPKPSQNVFTHF